LIARLKRLKENSECLKRQVAMMGWFEKLWDARWKIAPGRRNTAGSGRAVTPSFVWLRAKRVIATATSGYSSSLFRWYRTRSESDSSANFKLCPEKVLDIEIILAL